MSISYFNVWIVSVCLPFCFTNPVLNRNINGEADDYKIYQYITNQDQLMAVRNQLPVGVIGGKPISIRKRPYQVAIAVNGTFEGSGIILDRNWVATLASIVLIADPDEITILAGNGNYLRGKSYLVNRTVLHPDFDFYRLNYDIALINLKEPLKYSRTIRSIRIANSHLEDGSEVKLSGWGDTSQSENSETRLTSVNLKIVNKNKCRSSYNGYTISNTMICAFETNAGPCWFDFGDVITAKRHSNKRNKEEAYGLFSWSKGCTVNDYPGIYTDLVFLNPWIKSVINTKKTFNNRFSSDSNYEITNTSMEALIGKEIELEDLNRKFSDVMTIIGGVNTGSKQIPDPNEDDYSSSNDSQENDENIAQKIKDFTVEEKPEDENNAEEEVDGRKEGDEHDVDLAAAEILDYILENEDFFRNNNLYSEEQETNGDEDGLHPIVKRGINAFKEDQDNIVIEVIEEAITEDESQGSNGAGKQQSQADKKCENANAEVASREYLANPNTESINKYNLITADNLVPYVVNEESDLVERQIEHERRIDYQQEMEEAAINEAYMPEDEEHDVLEYDV